MIERLEKYYEDGYLIKQTHPSLPLTIWNYSQTTQYERKWDEITLMARGLVTDDKDKIVARPFDKFFNIEEGMHKASDKFEVYEKMDGSLGILFCYRVSATQKHWVFASRGSFTSDQAMEFELIFNSKYSLLKLDESFTYMFEIIYPENRVVVDYDGMRDIVLLGARKTRCGTEFPVDVYRNHFNVVKKYDGIEDFTKLKDMINDNQEGFVVRFKNTNSRCKIKGEEYLRLHKIMTEVSTTSVWRILSEGGNMEPLLADVPDEFYAKIREYEDELRSHFNWMDASIRADYKVINKRLNLENAEIDDKTFALAVKDNPFASCLFSLRNGREIAPWIWKKIRPEFKPL